LKTVWPFDENLSTGKRLYSTLDPVGEAEGTLLEESRLSLDWKTKDFSHFRRLYYCSNLANLDLSAMSIDSYPDADRTSISSSLHSAPRIADAMPACQYVPLESFMTGKSRMNCGQTFNSEK
jgi:hypothetical protein